MAKTAVAGSQIYSLLATVFREEPGMEFLDELRQTGFTSALRDLQLDLDNTYIQRPARQLLKELRVEFTRLFCGPGTHISPHESVQIQHQSGTLWGQQTAEVKRFVELAGFDYETSFTGIPDHVSVELEFLAKLTLKEAQSWQQRDSQGAGNALEWELEFIAEHAGKWMPDFSVKVSEQAQTPYYRVFASLLRRFLAAEKAEMPGRLVIAFSQPDIDAASGWDVENHST
jgi:putative dimethyl sulfoxide reductase chaperone